MVQKPMQAKVKSIIAFITRPGYRPPARLFQNACSDY
jgi:hypothetical protein